MSDLAADLAGAAALYQKKCIDKLEENVALLLAKLSDPASLVNVEASGALVDAVTSGSGAGLAALAEDYIKDNATALALAALDAVGLKDDVLDALNLFYALMAQAFSVYNDLVLMFLKGLAKQIQKEIDKKEEVNQVLKDNLTKLHNALLGLTSGDPAFNEYLKRLRKALTEIELARRDIVLVRNTFDATDRWLSKKYIPAKKRIIAASELIKPLEDNPYLQPTAKSLLMNLGLPSTDEQINNMMAIPVLSKNVIGSFKKYLEATLNINTRLVFFYAGLNALMTGLPNIMKKFVLDTLDSALEKLDDLCGSMGETLNGAETSRFGPRPGFQPVPIKVSVMAYKWMLDIKMIIGTLDAIPSGHVVVKRNKNGFAPGPGGVISEETAKRLARTLRSPIEKEFDSVVIGNEVEIFAKARIGKYRVVEVVSDQELILDRPVNNSIVAALNVEYEIITDALGAMNPTLEAVSFYKGVVRELKSLGNLQSGKAALVANEAQENALLFEAQLLSFLVEANVAVVSAKIRKESLALCRSFIARCDLVTQRDGQVKKILQRFIDFPLPIEETLALLEASLKKLLGDLGLDALADMIDKGDFAAFFAANSKTATHIGAALAAIALLKECLDNDADTAKLAEAQAELESEQDLLNIKISFNFDFAILQNIQDCLDLTAFAELFTSKKLICFLIKKLDAATGGGLSDGMKKMDDLLSF